MDASFIQSVAVIGAGGKMGRGICLCLLQFFAQNQHPFTLVVIDENPHVLKPLQEYLMTFLLKSYPQPEVDRLLNGTQFELKLSAASDAKLIFEAIYEDIDIKASVYTQLREICQPEALFLSNTSSIPIQAIEQRTQLEGRLIGFHFYNPASIQKLLELIASTHTSPEVLDYAESLAHQLGKTVVHAKDVAGFIGNGHFIREGVFAFQQLHRLRASWSAAESIAIINAVTRDFLVRPMGIFEVIDYVGIPVFKQICKTMDHFIATESIVPQGLDDFDPDQPLSTTIEADQNSRISEWLGPLPSGHIHWKAARQDANCDAAIHHYLDNLMHATTNGATLAHQFLAESHRIASGLVNTHVAASYEDVDQVLKLGFHHLYGTRQAVPHS